MTVGWPIERLLEASYESAKATVVDCGSCPVSLQCLSDHGGNGWTFDCCGATGVPVATLDEGEVVLLLDCGAHRFGHRAIADDLTRCPFCDSDLVTAHVLGMTPSHRYVPTVHAKVDLRARLAAWRAAIPAALDLKRRIEERKKR